MDNHLEKNPKKTSIHPYTWFSIGTLIIAVPFLFAGILSCFLFEDVWYVGIPFILGGLYGIRHAYFWLRAEVASPQNIYQERMDEISTFIAHKPPRLDIPERLFNSNLIRKTDWIGVSLIPGAFAFGTQYLFSGLPPIDFSWAALQGWLFLGALTSIGAIWFLVQLSARVWRGRLLRDGRVVDALFISARPTTWHRLISPNQGHSQYRATYSFVWEGVPHEATQIIHITRDQHYTLGGEYNYALYHKHTPIRLLVSPRDPKKVLWVEATLVSDPLYGTGLDD